MTMIDECNILVKIKRTLSTTAAEGAAALENNWLTRYPKPINIVTDQGPEFSMEFYSMCNKNVIKNSTSTSRNQQGKSLIERIHQTIGQVLRTVTAAKDPKTMSQAELVIE